MIRIVLLIFFFSISSVHAITLTQTVANDILFDLTPVAPTDAGDYFDRSYTRDTTLLTIDNIPNTTNWKIFAKLSNYVHGGTERIRVRIKRTGNGKGAKKKIPIGGENLITLSTNYIELFSGQGKRLDIPMRTKIAGIGVYDDYGIFDTTIEFKVETY